MENDKPFECPCCLKALKLDPDGKLHCDNCGQEFEVQVDGGPMVEIKHRLTLQWLVRRALLVMVIIWLLISLFGAADFIETLPSAVRTPVLVFCFVFGGLELFDALLGPFLSNDKNKA